jgi:putative Mn2+ efflux pump MntP
MDLITILLIALGLSMDAVAVAVSLGLTIKSLKIHNGVVIGLFFGVFQAIMPVIGWAAGRSLRDLIVGVDHWIAFVLLVIIGSKMIYESIRIKSIDEEIKQLSMHLLFILSIATSIDALAIGVSFAFLDITIVNPVIIIGLVTFLLSFLAVGLGKHLGYLFSSKIEIVGGVILIGIGIKILFEHIGFIF